MQQLLERLTGILSPMWEEKIAISIVFTLFFHHLFLFCIFCILVWLDCATRWIAISYKYNGSDSFIGAIKGIPAAHRAKAISSAKMRCGFYDKMGSYVLLVVGALLADSGAGHALFTNLVVSYLTATEFLSIIENLNDSGISALAGLVNIVKSKTGVLQKPHAGGRPNTPAGRRKRGEHKDDE